jgi:hypothetical protein
MFLNVTDILGGKNFYFFYKYYFDIDRNQFLENNLLLSIFFSTNSLFIFIKNKIKNLKKLIEIVVYKF